MAERPPVYFGNAHQHCKQSHQFREQLRAWVAMEIIHKEDIKYTFLCHLSQIVISKLEVSPLAVVLWPINIPVK